MRSASDVHGSEHCDEILVNAAAGEHIHVAEEADHILVYRGAHVYMTEKGDDIAAPWTIGIHAAEKANSVAGGIIGSNVDVAEELYPVILSTGRSGHKQQRCGTEDESKQTSAHRHPLCAKYTRPQNEKFPDGGRTPVRELVIQLKAG